MSGVPAPLCFTIVLKSGPWKVNPYLLIKYSSCFPVLFFDLWPSKGCFAFRSAIIMIWPFILKRWWKSI